MKEMYLRGEGTAACVFTMSDDDSGSRRHGLKQASINRTRPSGYKPFFPRRVVWPLSRTLSMITTNYILIQPSNKATTFKHAHQPRREVIRQSVLKNILPPLTGPM